MGSKATLRTVHQAAAVQAATLDLIVAAGVDALTLDGVAAGAGLPVASVERGYPDVTDLLVELWEAQCSAALEAVIDLAAAAAATPADPELAADLDDMIGSPPPALFAAVELCVVSHRIDELADVAARDVTRWLTGHRLVGGAAGGERIVVTALVGALLASVLRRRGVGDRMFEPSWAIALVHGMEPREWGAPPDADLRWERGGIESEMSLALVDATRTVIARSGVAGATAQRLRRAVDLPAGVVDRTIIAAPAMVDHLAEQIARTVLEPARVSARAEDGTVVTALARWIDRRERTRARMGLELHMSLCHGGPEPFRRSQVALFDALADEYAERCGGRSNARQVACLCSAAADGLVLLDDLAGSIGDLDWAPVFQGIIAAAERRDVVDG